MACNDFELLYRIAEAESRLGTFAERLAVFPEANENDVIASCCASFGGIVDDVHAVAHCFLPDGDIGRTSPQPPKPGTVINVHPPTDTGRPA
jgi:hypothetical protein